MRLLTDWFGDLDAFLANVVWVVKVMMWLVGIMGFTVGVIYLIGRNV